MVKKKKSVGYTSDLNALILKAQRYDRLLEVARYSYSVPIGEAFEDEGWADDPIAREHFKSVP